MKIKLLLILLFMMQITSCQIRREETKITAEEHIDSIAVSVFALSNKITPYEIVIDNQKLSLSHKEDDGIRNLVFQTYNQDTVARLMRYLTLYKGFETVMIDPDEEIINDLDPVVKIKYYSGCTSYYKSTLMNENRLYPLCFISFMTIINSIYNKQIHFDAVDPWEVKESRILYNDN